MSLSGCMAVVIGAPCDLASCTIANGTPSNVSVFICLAPSLELESHVDLWKLRNCPASLSICIVLSSRISMCFQDGDLMALSSTYADMLATLGCRLCNTAFAQAATGEFTDFIEVNIPVLKILCVSKVRRSGH